VFCVGSCRFISTISQMFSVVAFQMLWRRKGKQSCTMNPIRWSRRQKILSWYHKILRSYTLKCHHEQIKLFIVYYASGSGSNISINEFKNSKMFFVHKCKKTQHINLTFVSVRLVLAYLVCGLSQHSFGLLLDLVNFMPTVILF